MELFYADLIKEIFSYLEIEDIFTVQQVCHQWAKLGRERRNNILSKIPSLPEYIFEKSFSGIYPGIEKYLDYYHCLGRSIILSHAPSFAYFLKRATNNHLDVDDYTALFDLLAKYWSPTIFTLLIRRFFSCCRMYYCEEIFACLEKDCYLPYLGRIPPPKKYPFKARRKVFYDTLLEGSKMENLSDEKKLLFGRLIFDNNNNLIPHLDCSFQIRTRCI